MEINGKVVDALQMYTNLMKELPMYGYGGMPKLGMSQPYVQPGMPPQPQVILICLTVLQHISYWLLLFSFYLLLFCNSSFTFNVFNFNFFFLDV